MQSLYEQLENYSETDYYPFHMPGHKRNEDLQFSNPFHYDITEIEGFDNLHHSQGIILDAQKRAALLYNSSETHFLINGSTGGLLSAISSCTTKGGTVLIARNCHKAVYNAVFLNELINIYTYPQKERKFCVNGGLNIKDIKQLLINNKNIQAVVITSPTYDGIISDIESIAIEVHKFNIPLIVDEAHGAHLGFHSYFSENSISKGADIVIHSVHKTLPSLTQTALLHVNGNIVDRDKLRKYLAIYQTSSPSYVLMASIDNCINLISNKGKELFDNYVSNLSHLRESLSKLKNIRLVSENIVGNNDIFDLDRSKLIISVKNTDITGKELYLKLLNQYHLQMEMVSGDYVLGITTIMDKIEGYNRLIYALNEIDNEIKSVNNPLSDDTIIKPQVSHSIANCNNLDTVNLKLEEAEDKIAAEYIYLYPPGVPLIVPGEIISKELILQINTYKKIGLQIEGMSDYAGNMIKIVGKE
ncbi:MAG: aminotransferase class I/II-fold pyridoxal phosphate-dependent enzyme [Lachnotalea sp.]